MANGPGDDNGAVSLSKAAAEATAIIQRAEATALVLQAQAKATAHDRRSAGAVPADPGHGDSRADTRART